MNWSDERYVRLYTRDTVTWKRWNWQTRAVLALLIRRVDRSGVLDTGKGDKAEALALMLEVPLDVARLALAELTECGTVTATPVALVLPSFMDAQEAKQNDRVRQIESREKRKAATLVNHEGACHTPSQAVTDGHTVSQIVTPAVPSLAVLSLAVPSRAVPKKRTASPSPEVVALRAAWNDNTTPPLARWESGRDGIATNALKRRPLEQWVEVFKRINASPFCRGEDGGWKADVDWALRPEGRKPETAMKVLEGAYDRATPIRRGPVAAESVDWTDAQTGEVAFD